MRKTSSAGHRFVPCVATAVSVDALENPGVVCSDDPQKVPVRVPERVPVKLNRNFLNFPLARETRAKASWFQGSETGVWLADLPGEGRESRRIRLILPAKAEEEMRRCPSALDMNVLFQLLAEAQRPEATTRIEFASLSGLLRRLGLEERDRERDRVVSSIVYWHCLSIRWERWYEHHGHIRRKLSPPIKYADRAGNRLMITLHPERGPRVIIFGCLYRYRHRPRRKTLLC
jgi:hypothetical protein